MSSSNGSASSGYKLQGKLKIEEKKSNFMVPLQDSINVLKKRETFAVNLRKAKTKTILDQKRRKLNTQYVHTNSTFSKI
jgi:hypothetical protein